VVQLRYAYRLDPTSGQRIALAQAFGCARVVFNDAVAARRAAHLAGDPYPTEAALSRALTAAQRTPERAWPAEVSAVVLQQALADANRAYRNFFASLSGKRKGRRVGAPRFRSRRDRRQSIRFTHAARCRVLGPGRLRLPGMGDVPVVRWSRELPAGPSSVTVTVDVTGRYHASVVVEVADEPLPPAEREVGVDLGLAHVAVRSDASEDPQSAHRQDGGQETAARPAGTSAPPERPREPPESGSEGRDVSRPCRGHPPGLAAQAVLHDRAREPTRTKRCSWRTWPCPGWPGLG
jgi:putative transposase